MLRTGIFPAIFGFVLMASGVQAATLTNVVGRASVNTGNGFAPATDGAVLKPGDQVMTGNGSSVQVAYDLNCLANVGPNKVVVIQTQSPCAQPASQQQAQAGAAGGISPTTLVVGGLVVAGGVAAAIALSSASP